MKGATAVLFMMTFLMVGGCKRSPDHTQDEYDQNPDLAKQRLAECSSMTPAAKAQDQDCAFALSARIKQSNAGRNVKPERNGWHKN